MDRCNNIGGISARPQSHISTTGDVTQSIPGSYPTEDQLSPLASPKILGSDTNNSEGIKSKNPNELQEWTGSEIRAPRHNYSDSGVGLIEAHDSAPVHDPSDVALDNPTTLSTQRKIMNPDKDTFLNHEREIYSRTGSSGIPKSASHPTDYSSGSKEQYPYWGDLPQGKGTYNTILGHGSPEDQARRHKEIPNQSNEASSTDAVLQSVTDHPVNISEQQHLSPLANRDHTVEDPPTNKEQMSSSSKKGIVDRITGVSGLATAPSWAKTNAIDKDSHESSKGVDKLDHSKGIQGSKQSMFLGKLKRGKSPDKRKKEDHAKEHHSPKSSQIGGIFHGSHAYKNGSKIVSSEDAYAEDSQVASVGIASRTGNRDTYKNAFESEHQDHGFNDAAGKEDHHSLAPTLTLAGIAGAAVYSASKSQEKADDVMDGTSSSQKSQMDKQRRFRTQLQSSEQTSDSLHNPSRSGVSSKVQVSDSDCFTPKSSSFNDNNAQVGWFDTRPVGSQDLESQTGKPHENRINNRSLQGKKLSTGVLPIVAPQAMADDTSREFGLEGLKMEPVTTKLANKGEYNFLNSGTPSGINIAHDKTG